MKNTTKEQRKQSTLELTLSATMDKVVMIEAGGKEVPEDLMLDAIFAGHEAVKELCKQYFSMIEVTAGDKPGRNRKPAPDGVEYVLKQLDCEKNEAVYVGDSEIDILTAGNTGIDCINVAWGFRTERELLDNGAVNLIFKPNELLRLLEKL